MFNPNRSEISEFCWLLCMSLNNQDAFGAIITVREAIRRGLFRHVLNTPSQEGFQLKDHPFMPELKRTYPLTFLQFALRPNSSNISAHYLGAAG